MADKQGGNYMNRGWVTGLGVVIILLAELALPISYAPAAEDMDIASKVQAAKTAADHQALAEHFDQQAAEATKNAALHRRMGESYKGFATSIGKGSGVSSMPQHCEALAKNFEAEADHYKAMAQTHRDLAKAAK